MDPGAPADLPDAITVYWMPEGSAAEAPPEVTATPAYEDSLPAEFAGADVIVYRPTAIGFQDQDVTAAAVFCSSGWFCVFQHRDFGGDKRRFQDAGYWQHLNHYGFNDVTSSVKNHRARDSKLSQHINANHEPGGMIRCYDSNTNVSYVGDAFNDEASGLKNIKGDGAC